MRQVCTDASWLTRCSHPGTAPAAVVDELFGGAMSTPSDTESSTAARASSPRPRRRRGRRRAACAHRARAAAPAQVPGGPGRRQRDPAGAASRGVLRHRVPRHLAGGRVDLRPARRVARALGSAALWLPRPVARLDRTTGAARARRQLPPRRRRLALRHPRRRLGRHHHGVHASGGTRHGHPLGQRRPRAPALAVRARRAGWRRAGRAARWSTTPACSASPAPPTCARSYAAPRPATHPPCSAETFTCTGCAPGSWRWPRRSADSTSLVFTGGVGERSPEIRARTLDGLGFLGVARPGCATLAPRRRR